MARIWKRLPEFDHLAMVELNFCYIRAVLYFLLPLTEERAACVNE